MEVLHCQYTAGFFPEEEKCVFIVGQALNRLTIFSTTTKTFPRTPSGLFSYGESFGFICPSFENIHL